MTNLNEATRTIALALIGKGMDAKAAGLMARALAATSMAVKTCHDQGISLSEAGVEFVAGECVKLAKAG